MWQYVTPQQVAAEWPRLAPRLGRRREFWAWVIERWTQLGNLSRNDCNRSCIVVVAGLPGTGKSTIAEALGRAIGVPVFAKDWLDATLRCSLGTANGHERIGFLGYELLTVLARRQMALGQSVILDSVVGPTAVRDQWRALAAEYGAAWLVIECVCSDETAHRERLASRRRGLPDGYEVTWQAFLKVKARYTPWSEEVLVLDAAAPQEANIDAAIRYLDGR